jgi:hypothetical protein
MTDNLVGICGDSYYWCVWTSDIINFYSMLMYVLQKECFWIPELQGVMAVNYGRCSVPPLDNTHSFDLETFGTEMSNTGKVWMNHYQTCLICHLMYFIFCANSTPYHSVWWEALNDAAKNGSAAEPNQPPDRFNLYDATFSNVENPAAINMYEYHGYYTHMPT